MSKNMERKSVTLVELMVAVVIIFIALVSLIGAFTASFSLAEQAKEISIATDDLEDTLEYIRTLPFSDITDPNDGGFNNGDTVNQTIIGGFLLEDEVITVSYPNGVDADPLEIQLVLTWNGRYGRNGSLTFRTVRASGL